MKKSVLLLLLSCFFGHFAFAQFSYGFKAGLNYATFRGPVETDGSGKEVESYDFSSGFHVGGGLVYKITDLFGVKLDILFSQKGTFYKFDGPSYFVFDIENRNPLITTGNRSMELDVTNSYVDLPLMVYAKLGGRFELSGGVNIAFLVGSTASGELTYGGQTTTGVTIAPFTSALDFNYFKDEVGIETLDDAHERVIGSTTLQIPTTLNAFYEYDEKMDSYYNVIDFGLNAGLSYFINRGLYFGFRANFGLADITNEDYEVSLFQLNNGNKISRSDKDTNLALQASLGFTF